MPTAHPAGSQLPEPTAAPRVGQACPLSESQSPHSRLFLCLCCLPGSQKNDSQFPRLQVQLQGHVSLWITNDNAIAENEDIFAFQPNFPFSSPNY